MDAGGCASCASWISSRRPRIVLQKNLNAVLGTQSEMGATLSAQQRQGSATEPTYEKSGATKRRKLAAEQSPRNNVIQTPLSLRNNGRNSFVHSFDTGEHLWFQQNTSPLLKSVSQEPERSAVAALPEAIGGQRALRVDVSQILDKHAIAPELTLATETTEPPPISYCRCGIAIYQVTYGDGAHGKKQITNSHEMVRTSLRGSIERTGRIILPGPFLVPFHSLYMAGTQQFGENYSLQIWFESIGKLNPWPPKVFRNYLKGQGIIARRLREQNSSQSEIQLIGTSYELLDPKNQNTPIPLRLKLRGDTESTEFDLSVNIRWSLPIRLNNRVLSLTPGLKARESRKGTFTVKYRIFGDNGEVQQCCVQGWTCAICNRKLKTKDILHFHLVTDHDIFKFSLSQLDTVSCGCLIDIWKRGGIQKSSSCSVDTLSLGLPKEPFSLDRYLDGDQSWISRRLESPDSAPSPHKTRSSSSSTTESRKSSPSTSVDASSSNDNKIARKQGSSSRPGLFGKPLLQKPSPTKPFLEPTTKSPPRRRFIVPETPRALFDSLTMRALVPGEELRSPSPVDNSWKYAKHADIIDDFSDITPDEKDFIHRWDPFMMKENVTAYRGFPPALMKFLEINGDWFREKPSRSTEFMKHLMAIYTKGIIREDCLKDCSQMLRRIATITPAEQRRSDKGKAKVRMDAVEKTPQKPRGTKDCICGQPVFPSKSLTCEGPNCKHRFYHRDCVAENVPRRVAWRCQECS